MKKVVKSNTMAFAGCSIIYIFQKDKNAGIQKRIDAGLEFFFFSE